MAFQQIIVMGNLGRDPETRWSQDGKAITEFSIAVSEKYKDRESTEWFTAVAFGRTAEIAGEYLRKGSPVLITGRMKTESWEAKDTGETKYRTKIMVDKLQLIGGRRESGDERNDSSSEPRQPRSQQEKPNPRTTAPADDDSDIPF